MGQNATAPVASRTKPTQARPYPVQLVGNMSSPIATSAAPQQIRSARSQLGKFFGILVHSVGWLLDRASRALIGFAALQCFSSGCREIAAPPPACLNRMDCPYDPEEQVEAWPNRRWRTSSPPGSGPCRPRPGARASPRLGRLRRVRTGSFGGLHADEQIDQAGPVVGNGRGACGARPTRQPYRASWAASRRRGARCKPDPCLRHGHGAGADHGLTASTQCGLIRHVHVLHAWQGKGAGLRLFCRRAQKAFLIGIKAELNWAIRFTIWMALPRSYPMTSHRFSEPTGP